MARHPRCQIHDALNRVLPPERIEALARELGAVLRRRKLQVLAFVAALVFGSAGRQRRTLEGLRRLYERATGQLLARSSFHARLNDGMARLMEALCADALQRASRQPSPLARRFLQLRAVLVADSTMVRLSDLLQAHYPSVWTNHTKAGAKLTVVINVETRTPERLTIGPASRHDVHQITYGPWVRRRLFIADQAFTRALSLEQIEAHGGYFLGRLKHPTSPRLDRSHLGHHAHLMGQRLGDVMKELTDDAVDFDVTVSFAGKRPRRAGELQTRLVGVRAPDGRLRFYLTNLPHDKFSPSAIAALYAARWEVELLFREMKTLLRAADMPTSSSAGVAALLYASILAILASRALHQALIAPDENRYPMERFTALVGAFVDDLIARWLERRARPSPRSAWLVRLLLHQSRDPNASRIPLGHRLALASPARC